MKQRVLASILIFFIVLFVWNSLNFIHNIDLNEMIEYQNKTIKENKNYIENLQQNISNLTLNLKDKENYISNLSFRFETTYELLKKSKEYIQELTPITKEYYILAIKGGKGYVIQMSIRQSKGTGKLSININNAYLFRDTIQSIKNAASLASKITGINLNERDIIVTVNNKNNDFLELNGPSGGTAFAITMIAALQNKSIDSKTMVTGTINEYGGVGQVAGVPLKIQAAKAYGAEKFFAPKGQGVNIDGLETFEISTIYDILTKIIN